MVLSHGNTHSDTAKMEKIITEFFAKSVHIILESRVLYASSSNSFGGYKSDSSPCSSSSSSPSVKSKDRWFNLALRECPVALENININNVECVIVDVILVHRSLDGDPLIPKRVLRKERYPLCCSGGELGVEAKSEKILERWVVQYENRTIEDSNSGSCTRRSSNNSLQNLYKKSTLLLRSLYTTVRLLPAYKIFRELNSSARISPFTLAHRVSSFVEPFTQKQESEMMKYTFTPVDTSSGRLCLMVMYCPSALDLSSEQLSCIAPQVISDYVGSPLADPLRRFPSLPLAGFPCHGSSSPRRHSGNFDDSKVSTDSTMLIHSNSQIPVSNSSSWLFPPVNLPPDLCETSSIQKKDASVSVPNAEAVNSSGYCDRHNLPPSHPLRSSKCAYKIDRSTDVMQTGATAEKVFSLGKDELQKYPGVRISANSSSRISFSSRSCQDDFDDTDFSCPFDVDYDAVTNPGSRTESLCHSHMSEALEAGGLFPIRKSNDAAVGTLVNMLKKARPLHQDFYTSEHLTEIPALRVNLTTKPTEITVQKPNKENLSHDKHCETRNNIQELNQNQEASIATRKTTSDALKEFNGYREMKNLLVMRHGKPQI